MKKIGLVLLVCLLMCGCDQEKKDPLVSVSPDPVETKKPEHTPESTVDDEHSQEDETVDLGQDTEIVDETVVLDDGLEVSFIEETEVNPTTLTFHLDGTAETNLNVCSAMTYLTGTYTKDEDEVMIEFSDTGYDFLDGVPFTFNLIEDRLILDESSEMFSCSGQDSYKIRKVEE